MDFTEFEKSGWAKAPIAKSYADEFGKAAELATPALVDAAGVSEGSRVLDVCTGHGIVAEAMIRLGADVTGLDFSPAMLEMARARAPRATLIEGDAMALPFDAETYDAVTMGFGILHVPDAGAAVKEAARVLRPGGRFAYSCWHGPEKTSALAAMFGAIKAHGDLNVALPPSPPPPFYAQPENAWPIMEAAGLEDIRLDTAESYWICAVPDDPMRYFWEGTVRGAGLLSQQTPEAIEAIRSALSDWVTENATQTADGLKVPLPAAIISGARPA